MTDKSISEQIDEAVKNNDVVLFMKGTPTFPQCGFSSTVVQILDYLGAAYVSTNVLENQDIREGIKAYSDWPTIPQLYVKGEFVGGCDIVKEMFEAGELRDFMSEKGIVPFMKNNDVVLFMKGTPTFPQCGFSSTVVQILDYLGAAYVSTNVLENQDIREGIKAYSDWPTIPQLYVKGEFVGGCDIVKEMFEAGELRDFMSEKGIEVVSA